MICHLCLCIADTSALDQSVDVCVLNYMIVGKCVLLVERYGLQPLLGLWQEVHLGLLLCCASVGGAVYQYRFLQTQCWV